MPLFVADAGAIYDIEDMDGLTIARGVRSGTTYCSSETRIIITGKRRRHTGVGIGCRATLYLDTGEGISPIPGVYRADH